ncbi:MAG: hypothetical protein K2M86_06840, partial [Odoribacter sp.]|nr:hypothetical protein [Odoribacter sp.]
MHKNILFLSLAYILAFSSCRSIDSPCLTQIRQADLNHPIEKISDIVQDLSLIDLSERTRHRGVSCAGVGV